MRLAVPGVVIWMNSPKPKTATRPITKAKTILGWEPKIALRQGLELSLDYFRASLPSRSRLG
jgi:dTDP-glucose 4,6-dehydratase